MDQAPSKSLPTNLQSCVEKITGKLEESLDKLNDDMSTQLLHKLSQIRSATEGAHVIHATLSTQKQVHISFEMTL